MTQRILRFRSVLTRHLVLLGTLALLASLVVFAQAAGEWMATGDMVNGHMSHATALLADGRVLVAGGPTGFFSSAVELFDPATNTWTATDSMSVSRAQHTATTLNDGRVLVAGGVDSIIYASVTYDSVEIFDPDTGAWAATGSMTVAHSEHTATLLNDGRVLVAGGRSQFGSLHNSAEIFDPVTGTWSATGSMSAFRASHTATRLNDERVLVVGGLANPEIFDPASGTWATISSTNTARIWHSATLLNDGRVLVVGGSEANAGGQFIPLASAEIFDPATGTWTVTGALGSERARHTATLLDDGWVLAAGGFTNGATHSSAEIFDPAIGTWTTTGSMIDSRNDHTETLLNDGRVLVVGGSGSGTCCAELFALTGGGGTPPPPTPTATPTPLPAESITVLEPDGGEVWPVGSTQSIQWGSQGVTGNVKIQVSRNGGASYKQIANNVPNTGVFQWTVTRPATTQALIRVISIDQPNVQDTSDGIFSITQ